MDWNDGNQYERTIPVGHTLRGCVDWNLHSTAKNTVHFWSHPSWVCGLKRPAIDDRLATLSHTLRGCVDWNYNSWVPWSLQEVTPFVGVWIETALGATRISAIICHTLRGCVDWNSWCKLEHTICCVTPFVGVWIETFVALFYLSSG